MKSLILTLLVAICCYLSYGQNSVVGGGPEDVNFNDLNYYDVYEEYKELLENNPEALSESQLKKWARFNYLCIADCRRKIQKQPER